MNLKPETDDDNDDDSLFGEAKETWDPELTVEDLALMTPTGGFFKEEEDEWKRYAIIAHNFGKMKRSEWTGPDQTIRNLAN